MKDLNHQEELDFIKSLLANEQDAQLLANIKDSFNLLHTRAQMLLGLITICLTITGFSGPKIADSGMVPKILIVVGLLFVLSSAVMLLLGPLQLQWISQRKMDNLNATWQALLARRDQRTAKYERAVWMLVIGLTSYVGSLVSYMMGL